MQKPSTRVSSQNVGGLRGPCPSRGDRHQWPANAQSTGTQGALLYVGSRHDPIQRERGRRGQMGSSTHKQAQCSVCLPVVFPQPSAESPIALLATNTPSLQSFNHLCHWLPLTRTGLQLLWGCFHAPVPVPQTPACRPGHKCSQQTLPGKGA